MPPCILTDTLRPALLNKELNSVSFNRVISYKKKNEEKRKNAGLEIEK